MTICDIHFLCVIKKTNGQQIIYWKAKRRLKLSKNAFFVRPKVHSRNVIINTDPENSLLVLFDIIFRVFSSKSVIVAKTMKNRENIVHQTFQCWKKKRWCPAMLSEKTVFFGQLQNIGAIQATKSPFMYVLWPDFMPMF